MRESFVIHSEYIEDLPEEYKSEFLGYIYNYGILEQLPILEGLKKAIWVKIQRRIDMDIEAYSKRVEYQKAYYDRKKLDKINSNNSTFTNIEKVEKNNSTFTNIEKVEKNNSSLQMFSPNSRRAIEFDTEFEFDSEFEFDIEFDTDAKLTPPQSQYCKLIFEMWKGASLPGSKDEFSFRSKEFYQSIKSLKGLHSKDVIQAIKNYISVLNDKNCYLKKKYCFDSFVASKVFKEMLPDRFVKENFRKFNTQATISNDSDTSDYSFAKVSANGK